MSACSWTSPPVRRRRRARAAAHSSAARSRRGGKNLLLARDEAFALGHTLGFSLAEMQWFLLRTLDTEDGLRYHASGDLVETFGFVTGMGEKSVAALKARCARMLADIPKAECDGREGTGRARRARRCRR